VLLQRWHCSCCQRWDAIWTGAIGIRRSTTGSNIWRAGLCCSYADGYVVTDADWETRDSHYHVRVPRAADSKEMVWVDVPDEAVITEPNKAGRTMVWPLYGSEGVSIRCFMPGSMT
jgi:hypothetical protein